MPDASGHPPSFPTPIRASLNLIRGIHLLHQNETAEDNPENSKAAATHFE
jgi:hypothetical protein